jgi:ankyrin repeat protein
VSDDLLRRLHEAIARDDGEAVAVAIAAGSPLTGALRLAIERGRAGMLRPLLAAGADVHERRLGQTPLHAAAMIDAGQPGEAEAPAMIAALLEAGADPTAPASEEPTSTPIAYAARWGSVEALRRLLADERARQGEHLAAALLAAVGGRDALAKVELLLAQGADPTAPEALLRACERTRGEVALRLLAAGARADVADKRGCTALHRAVAAGTEEVVAALVARGAAADVATKSGLRDLDIRKGETPRDVAARCARFRQVQVVEAILRALRVPAGDVGLACAKFRPDEEGAWLAAAAYAEAAGDRSAANRARTPDCREDIDPGPVMLLLRSAARIAALVGVNLDALCKPAFRPGTWTLRRVENESGPIEGLKRWLRGKPPYTLELDADGAFRGALRGRKLRGRWTQNETHLSLVDAELGELESLFDHEGIWITQWHEGDEASFTRYVFALR